MPLVILMTLVFIGFVSSYFVAGHLFYSTESKKHAVEIKKNVLKETVSKIRAAYDRNYFALHMANYDSWKTGGPRFSGKVIFPDGRVCEADENLVVRNCRQGAMPENADEKWIETSRLFLPVPTGSVKESVGLYMEKVVKFKAGENILPAMKMKAILYDRSPGGNYMPKESLDIGGESIVSSKSTSAITMFGKLATSDLEYGKRIYEKSPENPIAFKFAFGESACENDDGSFKNRYFMLSGTLDYGLATSLLMAFPNYILYESGTPPGSSFSSSGVPDISSSYVYTGTLGAVSPSEFDTSTEALYAIRSFGRSGEPFWENPSFDSQESSDVAGVYGEIWKESMSDSQMNYHFCSPYEECAFKVENTSEYVPTYSISRETLVDYYRSRFRIDIEDFVNPFLSGMKDPKPSISIDNSGGGAYPAIACDPPVVSPGVYTVAYAFPSPVDCFDDIEDGTCEEDESPHRGLFVAKRSISIVR